MSVSKFYKGKIVYRLYFDEVEVSTELEEWHVTSVRGDWVYLREKSSYTWGKLSSQRGHYGWLPNPPDWATVKIKNDQPSQYSATPEGAYRVGLRMLKKRLAKLKALVTRTTKKAGKF